MTDIKQKNNKAGRTLWLELSILLILLLGTIGFLAQLDQQSSRLTESGRLIGKAEQVQAQLGLLRDKSAVYLDQAPRNYDDYFRDTKVIHAVLLQEISVIDAEIRTTLAASPESATHGENRDQVYFDESSRQQLLQSWVEFSRKLDEQLGVDPEMPRLEWGYRHINEGIDEVSSAIDGAIASLRSDLESFAGLEGKTGLLLVSVLVWSLLLLLWFHFRVMKPRPAPRFRQHQAS